MNAMDSALEANDSNQSMSVHAQMDRHPLATVKWTSLTPLHLTWAGMMLGLFWKWSFFLLADRVYHAIPIQHTFFPQWLQSATVLRAAYVIAAISILLAWITEDALKRKVASAITWLAATVMLWHQGSYNDMTFVTFWWCSLWAFWYCTRLDVDSARELQRKASRLSRVIVSVVLLGGAAGKWTPEYWSGEVLWEIYFVDRDFWVFNWLRSTFETETLRTIATAYSRKVVLVEAIGGLGIWLLPPRWAAIIGACVFTFIALFSNFMLFSVLCPLIGLSLAGWIPSKLQSKTDFRNATAAETVEA
ncbi:hypothetical protein LOC71_10740 [Rhodopirellula sp. JC740]|uniref:HTTM domain-containing protein n=1 Tax=Rhodopirellula halodulae TaxID=2894198 RepID=A0ABS8NGS6_9BACT|nr:hypothetical protein [Rhodopirellula sp. JC740]MCC9642751.1 hypothetical protein [Rhodopirellula sp. JC740]